MAPHQCRMMGLYARPDFDANHDPIVAGFIIHYDRLGQASRGLPKFVRSFNASIGAVSLCRRPETRANLLLSLSACAIANLDRI
jgi:hypothetical protein